MRSAFTVAALAAVSLLAACSGSPSGTGPTTTTGAPALKLEEVSRIVVENFSLIWPKPVSIDINKIDRAGCYTNPATLMPEGPPWIPSTRATVFDPSQEFIDKALANLEAMTARGFVRSSNQVPGADPVDRSYKDSRGFSVSVSRDPDTSPLGVMFSMSAAGPCADE